MENKIIKYKLKKNKLEEKIIDFLKEKKTSHDNEISKINNIQNKKIVLCAESFFTDYVLNNSAQLVIIVSGFYSVGKSTFISNIEKYINSFLLPKYNIDEKKNFKIKTIICDDNLNFKEYLNNTYQILILKCTEFITGNEIYSMINSKFKIHINIIPKDQKTLKNKFVNRIIRDIKNNSSNFITNINLSFVTNNIILKTQHIDMLEEQINLLKNKIDFFTDDDFQFINEITNIIYDFIQNYYNKVFNNIKDKSDEFLNYHI